MPLDMDDIASLVRERKQNLGLSYQDLANRTGMTKSTLQRYASGEIKNIPLSRLRSLATALEISENQIIGVESPFSLHDSPDWSEPLVSAYASAVRPKQDAVCAVLDIDHISPDYAPPPETEPFRISEQPAAAGTGVYLGPESFYEIYVNVNTLPRGAIFGIPVRGDSMQPDYQDGDILIISKDEPAIGEIGVFTLDGQGYVKTRGESSLLSLNDKYDPIPMNDSIRCNGKVVGVLDGERVLK